MFSSQSVAVHVAQLWAARVREVIPVLFILIYIDKRVQTQERSTTKRNRLKDPRDVGAPSCIESEQALQLLNFSKLESGLVSGSLIIEWMLEFGWGLHERKYVDSVTSIGIALSGSMCSERAVAAKTYVYIYTVIENWICTSTRANRT
jgi:hypothetical protein